MNELASEDDVEYHSDAAQEMGDTPSTVVSTSTTRASGYQNVHSKAVSVTPHSASYTYVPAYCCVVVPLGIITMIMCYKFGEDQCLSICDVYNYTMT